MKTVRTDRIRLRADAIHSLLARPMTRYLANPILSPLLLVMAQWCWPSADTSSAAGPAVVVNAVSLQGRDVDESSGLAVSRRRPDHFWTHNDSGGQPKLYAFRSSGSRTGDASLKVARTIDWEDMASFRDGGVARLLIADCGDNDAQRESIELHLFDEPDPRESSTVHRLQTLRIKYPDGPRDCEAIGVDSHRRQIVLITKTLLPACAVYVVPLPKRSTLSSRVSIPANRVTTLPMPMVTAMDIDASNGDLWATSYFQAFCFSCNHREMPVKRQLSQLPKAFELPRWKQIEAVAVDQSQHVWVTSEGLPAKLGRLP